jgi:DASH complex subunit DAM1
MQRPIDSSTQNLRRNMEAVIESLIDSAGKGVKRKQSISHLDIPERPQPVPDLIKPPDLNQAKVNKCLIALVNRKVVRKENFTVSVLCSDSPSQINPV